MRKFLIVLLRFFFNYRPQSFFPTTDIPPIHESRLIQQVTFFIVAHADDIELFMGKEAQHQIHNPDTRKIVFIVLSAGDANRKNRKKIFRKLTWWQAREQAHTAAISAWNQHQDAAFEQEVKINGKIVTKIDIGNRIALYNFRLTDADKTTSLAELAQVEKTKIIDLAHQQHYTLECIKRSLIEIINAEAKSANQIVFHITDPDDQRNPEDHKDHQATSLITLDAIQQVPLSNREIKGYLTYSIFDKPINLTGEARASSFRTWKLMGDVLEYYGYKRNDDPRHMQWVGKEYLSFKTN